MNKYPGCEKWLSSDQSTTGKQYVCLTCHKYLKKQNLPPQNFNNKLKVLKIPEELATLSSLEAHLIAQRLPFMKIMSRPSGGQSLYLELLSMCQ